MLKSKIHGATVTETKLHYEGSITLDEEIMKAADILPGEQLLVLNLNNGIRFITYAIKGEKGSGIVCINGPAARLAQVGDKVIVLSFGIYEEEELESHKSILIKVDERNRIIQP